MEGVVVENYMERFNRIPVALRRDQLCVPVDAQS